MRYAKALLVPALLASLAFVAGCSAASDEEDVASAADSHLTAKTVTLTFRSDFTIAASDTIVKGDTVKIAYDASRLTTCRGDITAGHPGWSIGASYSLNGAAAKSVNVAGLNPDPSATPTFTVNAAGDLAIWFENNSTWGCDAFDSNYGANYHFTVVASANAPGWIGNAQVVTSRATCNNGPCDADFHDLGTGFTYDTWTRQQAAIREAYFQVWQQGVTDFDNANLWKQLDVEVHSRIGGTGDFTMAYVGFDTRLGNNARYALDLRTLDPLAGPGGGNGSQLTDKSQCPTFPVTYEGTGAQQMIDADVQFYFTVNGEELRPADGTVFHGKYQNYGGLYSICQSF